MDDSTNFSSIIHSDCIPQRDIETDYTTEWFEDAASEADWVENISLHGMNSSTACSLEGSVRSMTLLDELYEKNKILELEWREAEKKYQNLQVENQKLNIQLANERHRANKYQKKLQYIQDNHEIFNRLKQAYLNMKYNEATGRTMVEIRETGCQTWDGILCERGIETTQVKRQAGLANEPELVTVKKTDFSKLQLTVQELMKMIDVREQSWSFNIERENNYKATISKLQTNIQLLNDLIVAKHNVVSSLNPTDSTPEMIQKENGFLKRIIVKLEKRQRDMEKLYKNEKRPALLNEQEKQIVQQLIQRCANKLKHKITRSLSCDTGSSSHPSAPMLTTRAPTHNLHRAEASAVGSGEEIIFNIRLPNLSSSANYSEKPEKPLSPRKKNILKETDLMNFSDNTLCTSTTPSS